MSKQKLIKLRFASREIRIIEIRSKCSGIERAQLVCPWFEENCENRRTIVIIVNKA
jgi:hypothetical protein